MSKDKMQRGAHIAGVWWCWCWRSPGGMGHLALSPCSGSEVRVLLFNATGDRDTAALLKLLVVRFGGHRGVTVSGCLGSLVVLLCCGCREPQGGAGSLSVCLSAHPAILRCIPPQLPPVGVSQSWGQGRDLDHPLPHPL